MTKNISISFCCLLVFGLISCASSGQLSDGSNTKTYNKNIQTINNYFLQISRNSSFLVDIIQNDANDKFYTISKRQSTSEGYNRTQVGRVHISFASENKTTVKIENPDYAFGFPEFKKVDYQRIIFDRLEAMLLED